jgi:2-alkenal reductase
VEKAVREKPRLGIAGIALVAIISIVCGGIAGAVVAKNTGTNVAKPPADTKQSSTTGTSNVSVVTQKPESWAAVAQRVGPAVVTIVNTLQSTSDIFGNVIPGGTAEGSGFIIDRKGDIVTNDHVIDGAQSLQVVFANGKKTPATLVSADKLSDLAVIRVHVPVPATLSFGDSSKLVPGEPVMAIGSALGDYRNSVTTGVISATGRTVDEPDSVSLHDMLQTDAAINQGNSGGPLLNDQGQVIGVNTAVNRGSTQSSNIFGFSTGSDSVVAEGLGFALPSDNVKNVAARLVENKPTAFLGVSYHPISQQDANFYSLPMGAYVNAVRPGSPAEKAGIKQRDVITKMNGQPLNDTYTLERIVSEHSPGDHIKVTIWRSGKTLTLDVTLGRKPKSL